MSSGEIVHLFCGRHPDGQPHGAPDEFGGRLRIRWVPVRLPSRPQPNRSPVCGPSGSGFAGGSIFGFPQLIEELPSRRSSPRKCLQPLNTRTPRSQMQQA